MTTPTRLLATLAACAVFASALCFRSAFARQAHSASPATQPAGGGPAGGGAGAADDDMLISKMRVQDLKGGPYFYLTTETTIPQLGDVIPQLMTQLGEMLEQQKFKPRAAPIFVYKGMTGDMSKPFTLEVGFPCQEGAEAAGDAKPRQLEDFHCATVIYSGPVSGITQAYQQVFGEIFAAGLQPTGETREMHLYFESPESKNNMELIMVGIK